MAGDGMTSYHWCPRFARHPVLSWISLPKGRWKNCQHKAHKTSIVSGFYSNRDKSSTHSVTFKARWTPLSLEKGKLEGQTGGEVLTNLKQTKINKENLDLLWLPQLPGSRVRPEGQNKDRKNYRFVVGGIHHQATCSFCSRLPGFI